MEKSPDAFRTISEVADELDVPQHVLRFWETRFSQIRPMKRAGGRRYYRPADVDLLRGIRKLLYGEGYTIKGVQKILREHGVAHVVAIGRGEMPAAAAPPVQPAAPPPPASSGGAPPVSADATPRAEVAEAAPDPAEVAARAAPSPSLLSDQHAQTLRDALRDLEAARLLLLEMTR